MNSLIKQIFCLGYANYQAGLALARKVTLEQSCEFALSKWDHFKAFLVFAVLIVSHGLEILSLILIKGGQDKFSQLQL